MIKGVEGLPYGGRSQQLGLFTLEKQGDMTEAYKIIQGLREVDRGRISPYLLMLEAKCPVKLHIGRFRAEVAIS